MTVSLRLLWLFLSTFFFLHLHAGTYTFTGNGLWTQPLNWDRGQVPPAPLPMGDTVIIKGTASVTSTCTNCSASTLLNNGGTIIIASGGTLTLQDLTQLSHIGSIIINGTLTNKTLLEIFPGSSMVVNGSLVNQRTVINRGSITVNAAGIVDNMLDALFSGVSGSSAGTLTINNGGTFINRNSAVFNPGMINNYGSIVNQAVLTGNTAFNGSVTNNNVLAPGNSAGTFTINGNYTASSTAVHNFELGGTTDSTYDKLKVTGNVHLNGVLNVNLINGFVPGTNHDLTIVTGKINGNFSSIHKPAKYIIIYNNNSVVLRYSISPPMVYIQLNVKKEGRAAKLSWEIHNEPSIAYYDIERSAEGVQFEKIGRVNASMTGQYEFTDLHPKDKNFYRIKVVDIGGTYRYSSVMTLQQGQAGFVLNVFPSPADKEITVQHASAFVNSKLLITSLDGRLLKTVSPQPGTQQTLVGISSFNEGTYLVQFQNGTSRVEAFMFHKK